VLFDSSDVVAVLKSVTEYNEGGIAGVVAASSFSRHASGCTPNGKAPSCLRHSSAGHPTPVD
jgi:hypothetical protein